MSNWDTPLCIVDADNARNLYDHFREGWISDVRVNEDIKTIITAAQREVDTRSWLKNNVVADGVVPMVVVVIQWIDMTEPQTLSRVVKCRQVVCGYV